MLTDSWPSPLGLEYRKHCRRPGVGINLFCWCRGHENGMARNQRIDRHQGPSDGKVMTKQLVVRLPAHALGQSIDDLRTDAQRTLRPGRATRHQEPIRQIAEP